MITELPADKGAKNAATIPWIWKSGIISIVLSFDVRR